MEAWPHHILRGSLEPSPVCSRVVVRLVSSSILASPVVQYHYLHSCPTTNLQYSTTKQESQHREGLLGFPPPWLATPSSPTPRNRI
jgi:hypothetical protein